MSSRDDCLQLLPQTHAGKCSKLTSANCRKIAQRLKFNLKSHSISWWFYIASEGNQKREEGWRVQIVRNLYRFWGKYSGIFYIKCHGKQSRNNRDWEIRRWTKEPEKVFLLRSIIYKSIIQNFFAQQKPLQLLSGNVCGHHRVQSCETMQDWTRKATELSHPVSFCRQTRMEATHK